MAKELSSMYRIYQQTWTNGVADPLTWQAAGGRIDSATNMFNQLKDRLSTETTQRPPVEGKEVHIYVDTEYQFFSIDNGEFEHATWSLGNSRSGQIMKVKELR